MAKNCQRDRSFAAFDRHGDRKAGHDPEPLVRATKSAKRFSDKIVPTPAIFRVFMFRFASFASLALSLALPAIAQAQEKPKQLVMISFDGAHDNALWTKSREIASRNGAHFTYFLSCTFLMNHDQAKAYQAPGQKSGKSNVGFAKSEDDVRTRIANIWGAHLEGHDISSHACGHFDGKKWTAADWEQEFMNARVALRDAWKNVGEADKEPPGWQEFATKEVKGFRAPYLSTSDGLVPAEKAMGFQYDASLVTKGPILPQVVDGIYRFGLPLIPEGPDHHLVIGMDYNFYVHHSKGVEDKADSKSFEDRTFAAAAAAPHNHPPRPPTPRPVASHFV
jgi:peptidoglycan/xylan/chitin deacetylase (PgdA/CDA1 family)